MAILSRFMAGQRYAVAAPYVKGKVLELGCDAARVLERYRAGITAYVGVERLALKVEQLCKQYPQASFVRCDLDREQLTAAGPFDCVLMIALIEHLFNQQFVMSQVVQKLKPGGLVVITTPTPFGNDVVHRWGAKLGLFAKSAVDDHIVIYNRHRFNMLAKEVGLTLKRHEYFQLYCNQLVVLEKPGATVTDA
jgi:SAM-dependent methyltransferase